MSLLSSIARGLGLEAKATRVAGGGSGSAVIPDLALWNQSARIGGGITPARISVIVRMADNGEMRQLMDLANECRQRDSHLQAVLATSEESIASRPWQLIAPEGEKERAKDEKARLWCERMLRACPNFPRLLGHLAGAVFYGYSVSETIWKKVDGKLVPIDFRNLAHRRFGFRIQDGTFVWRDPGMGQEGVDFRADYPHKFIVAQPRVNGDIPNREGLSRALIWMSVFRNWVIADWLKTAETSWKPWRIGVYAKNGNSTEDKDDLEAVMRRLTTDGSAVIPNTCGIDVNWPGGTATMAKTHAEFVNVLGMEMSKAVLGQTETTQSSASSGYAQAKVHDDVRKDLLESRARMLSNDITRDLIASMILLNFGPDTAVPRFEFVTQDPVDLKAFGEALQALVGVGLPVPVKWALNEAGIPEREEDEPILEALAPPVDPNKAPPANDNEDSGGDGGKKPAPNPSAGDGKEDTKKPAAA